MTRVRRSNRPPIRAVELTLHVVFRVCFGHLLYHHTGDVRVCHVCKAWYACWKRRPESGCSALGSVKHKMGSTRPQMFTWPVRGASCEGSGCLRRKCPQQEPTIVVFFISPSLHCIIMAGPSLQKRLGVSVHLSVLYMRECFLFKLELSKAVVEKYMIIVGRTGRRNLHATATFPVTKAHGSRSLPGQCLYTIRTTT